MSIRQILAVGLFCLVAGFQALSAAEEIKDKKLFLSIGIGDFEDKRWPSLHYVEKDASRIYDSLKSSFDGGVLLTHSKQGSPVKKSDILQALDRLSSEVQSESDVVVIYFSGHGTLALAPKPEAEGLGLRKFLVTADTEFAAPQDTGLSMDEVLNRFRKLKSRRKALIVDSCYAGGGKAYLTPRIQAILAQQKAGAIQEPSSPGLESAAIYTASAWAEEAQESEQLQASIYTHFLLEGFQKDLDGDGAVSLSEAHHYASNRVVDFTHNAQHPTAKVEYVGRDPVIVNGKARGAGNSILYAWQFALRRFDVLVNKSPLGTLENGALVVPEGHHTLQLLDPKTKQVVLEKKVKFEKGRDYSVSDFFSFDPLNRLDLEVDYFVFADEKIRERWSPRAWTGFQLRYARLEFWRDWQLVSGLGILRDEDQKVKVDLSDDSGEKTGKSIQTIQAYRASVSLGQLTSLPSLSSLDADIHTHWLRSFGIEGQQLNRNLQLSAGLDLENEKRVIALALARSALLIERGQLAFSLGLELAAGPNNYTDEGSLALAVNGFLSLGGRW